MATDLIDAGVGDSGRLAFILECIDKNKPLYRTDMIFLESMTNQLDHKIKTLKGNENVAKEKSSRTLISDEHLDEIIGTKNPKNESIEKNGSRNNSIQETVLSESKNYQKSPRLANAVIITGIVSMVTGILLLIASTSQ